MILIVMAACFISRVRSTKLSPTVQFVICFSFLILSQLFLLVFVLIACFLVLRVRGNKALVSELSVQSATNFCVVLVYFFSSSSSSSSSLYLS